MPLEQPELYGTICAFALCAVGLRLFRKELG